MFIEPVEIYLLYVSAPIPHSYGMRMVLKNAPIERIVNEDVDQAMINSKILFDI